MKWKEREEQLENLLSAEQDAGPSVGIVETGKPYKKNGLWR